MDLNLRIIEADDVPAMDSNGLCDPYCKIVYSRSPKDAKHTKKLKKTLQPKWNDVFTFDVTNFSPSDYVTIKLKDQDFAKSEQISTINLPIIEFQPGKVYDLWKDMVKDKGAPKGGRIHIVVHVTNKGCKPFVESVISAPASRDVKPNISAPAPQTTTTTAAAAPAEEKSVAESSPAKNADAEKPAKESKPAEVPNVQEEKKIPTEPVAAQPKPPEPVAAEEECEEEILDDPVYEIEYFDGEQTDKPKKDYSKYHVTIISFDSDKVHLEGSSEDVGGELGRQLIAVGLPVKNIIIRSATNAIRELFEKLEKDEKSLILCVGSTASTNKLRLINEAYNEANFMVPDIDGIVPEVKIIKELEERVTIENPINLKEINDGIGSIFKISHDDDRFLFNYLYALGLSNVGKKIGGCVFVETPLIETIPMQYQVDSMKHLLDSLIELPAFN